MTSLTDSNRISLIICVFFFFLGSYMTRPDNNKYLGTFTSNKLNFDGTEAKTKNKSTSDFTFYWFKYHQSFLFSC